MAASGFTPISLYYSTTASAVPTSGNLANGELGLNIADMKLYAKNSSGVVTLLASNASTAAGVDSLSFGSTGLTPSTATTGAITVAGTLATTNGGTGLTSFTSGGVVYASSTSALANGSALTFDGTNLSSTGGATFQGGPTGYGGGEIRLGSTSAGLQSAISTQSTASPILFFDHRGTSNTGIFQWRNGTGATNTLMYLNSTGLGIGTTSPSSKFVVSNAGAAGIEVNPIGVASSPVILSYNRSGAAYTQLTYLALQHVWQNSGTEVVRINSSGAWSFGSSGTNTGTSGQVLTSGGSGAAPTWANAATGTVTSITVAAGTGMSGGGTVTTSGTVTLTNAGVTSVTAGTGISVSASTGGVTISSTAASGAQAFIAFGSTGGF